jgi:hypothetical protein
VVGFVAIAAVGWRQLVPRSGHALPALALGGGLAGLVLAYPIWFGLAGPQAVTGVLFAIAPLSGAPPSGLLSPGAYGAAANAYVRLGGYLGHIGPPPDYIGAGVALGAVASVVLARRRALTWMLVLLALAALVLSFGPYLIGTPYWVEHLDTPWRAIGNLPLVKEILPDQLSPFVALFLGFLLALGLDAIFVAHRRPGGWLAVHRRAVTAVATVVLAVAAVVPVALTFDVPLRVERTAIPPYLRQVAPTLPANSVMLTMPFAISGLSEPMLWQAVDGFHFRLAGAALKTPDSGGGPIEHGQPGSARWVLTNLSLLGEPLPSGTAHQLFTVRQALVQWHVNEVVIAGNSRDPVYASGFFTKALGVAPVFTHGAWVWTLPRGWTAHPPAFGGSLPQCRAAAGAPAQRTHPLSMSTCVLFGAGIAVAPTSS